ncbi:hypothetical protein CBS101457_005762 [Exobasidium rhododendri]|nr:hypothetical protein CBS101457_005762 [Exobasidium rhododendri]
MSCRPQMFDSVHQLSASLRNAANQCDTFVKVISRHHPSAAATAFASNVGADFLALANGNGLGGGGLHPSATQPQAHHHHHAGNPAMVAPPPTSGTPGRKPMSKEEKKALRKERKANRDPNAPKRPPSAYLLFQNEIREDMRQRYKELTYSEVLGKISEAWKALTEEQRKVYQDKTVESMARWNQEKKSHQSSG